MAATTNIGSIAGGSDNRDDRYNYLYKPAELEKWKEKVEIIAQRAESTYVIANNHFQAKAAVNALELRHLLDGKKVRAPETLVRHYPELREMVEMEDASGSIRSWGERSVALPARGYEITCCDDGNHSKDRPRRIEAVPHPFPASSIALREMLSQ